jgi:hypothetical protein
MQNENVNATSAIKSINDRRIRDLESERKPLQQRFNIYQSKLMRKF